MFTFQFYTKRLTNFVGKYSKSEKKLTLLTTRRAMNPKKRLVGFLFDTLQLNLIYSAICIRTHYDYHENKKTNRRSPTRNGRAPTNPILKTLLLQLVKWGIINRQFHAIKEPPTHYPSGINLSNASNV